MKKRETTGSTSWRLLLIVAVVALSVGAFAGFLISPIKTPGITQENDTAKELDTPATQFLSPNRLGAQPTLSASGDLHTQASGILTGYACSPGAVIKSGTSFLSIDESPILALHTEVPLWRDLEPGMKGSDVRALQTELARLGYHAAVTGTWQGNTTAAVKKLWQTAGVKQLDTLALNRVIWLPGTEVGIKTCTAQLGTTLNPDTSVATINDVLAQLQVKVEPGDARVAIAGDVEVDIPADGSITDAAFLTAFSATTNYLVWSQNPDERPLNVQTQLKTPLSAIIVPPSALYNIKGQQACVVSGKKAFAVQIIDSEFGKTTVTAKNEATLPKSVRVKPGKDAPPCA
ncbi:MAG: peptidoglycan-binding domain-containing protein [Mobiluncus sp.]|nr:peptidoglycan-binding domain-containing protein [Mobiluncus sp.]